MHFLKGDIFPQILEYKKSMRSTPNNVIKSWAKNTPHILNFINCLIRNQVSSKQALVEQWRTNQNCKLT